VDGTHTHTHAHTHMRQEGVGKKIKKARELREAKISKF
jgi:hypothetical protein